MQQVNGGAIDLDLRYRRVEAARSAVSTANPRWVVETGMLFLVVCMFWGLILFEMLGALR